MPAEGAPFLAVDVGGSSVKHALVVDGRLEAHAREPVAPGLDGLVAQLRRIHGEAAVPSWGLCIAGLVDAERGVVRYASNLPLRETPLVELLPAPAVFANDLVAATVGEADGGTLALLQAGTGIAGRCAVAGRVDARPYAGEVGHLRFRRDGLRCRCGQFGCAEAYGAWGGILDRHAAAGRPEPTPGSLYAEIEQDAWAHEVLDDALEAIGFAASALVAACDPGTLRVGGGVAAAWGETLLEAIRGALATSVLPDVASATTVEPARLGEAAALVGLYRLSLEV
ncbi:MAG TPA: ROK family protein [Gaiellaceae bacterium]|nr:ROK family protein [Gaiellaceae bacterium]